jgi:hypothetical protein
MCVTGAVTPSARLVTGTTSPVAQTGSGQRRIQRRSMSTKRPKNDFVDSYDCTP